MRFEDWGVVEYEEALERQRDIFERVISASVKGREGEAGDRGDGGMAGVIVFCEHPPVFTIGRNGDEGNVLRVAGEGGGQVVRVVRTDRGGDVTFHGPGQLVCYLVLRLGRMGLREYVCRLEQAVIETLAEFGIEGVRTGKGAGIWTSAGKICAVGIRASRGVVMHGLALNVTTDLGWFGMINPCGMVGEPVAKMGAEMGDVKRVLKRKLIKMIIYANREAMGDPSAG